MKSIYFICIHCETPFAVNVPDELYEEYKSSQYNTQVLFEWFEENGYGECPHKGCDGSLIDYWDLADWRKQGREFKTIKNKIRRIILNLYWFLVKKGKS